MHLFIYLNFRAYSLYRRSNSGYSLAIVMFVRSIRYRESVKANEIDLRFVCIGE